MITYQVEPWSQALPDMQPYFLEHFKEVAVHQDQIPLQVDWDAYARMEQAGELHVVTCRCDGLLVGYIIYIVRAHLHYRQCLTGFCDVYYLAPEHRRGLIGYRLFQAAERSLRARGVQRLYTGTKRSLDMSRLFERLGWEHTEQLFCKYIGE